MSRFFAIVLTLFFVIDAFGHIPDYLNILKPYEGKKRLQIVIRELIFALVLMFVFHFVGSALLTLLKISKSTVQISGGVVLFLIAIRLIYATEEDKPKWAEHEPFIVPIATPIIAGASSLAVIMIFSQETGAKFVTLCAIFLAWLASSIIYLFARPIYKIVTEKGLLASQRLMGLIVAIIAVQTAIEGLQGWMKT